MPRSLVVLIVVFTLLAGALAFRGPVPVTHAAPRDVRAMARPRVDIPLQPLVRPARPVVSPMSGVFMYTVAARLTVRDEPRWVVVRTTESGEQAVVVSAPDGRVPAFASADSARAWAERTLTPPKVPPEEARFLARMSRMLERAGVFDCDLDRAYAWASAPRRAGLAADTLLSGWSLLAMSSELPRVQPGDPMGIAQARGEIGTRVLTEEEELTRAMAKVDLVVRLAHRQRKQTGDAVMAQWPPAPYWSDADARRVAGAMRGAIVAFAARLTRDRADVEDIGRALASASR